MWTRMATRTRIKSEERRSHGEKEKHTEEEAGAEEAGAATGTRGAREEAAVSADHGGVMAKRKRRRKRRKNPSAVGWVEILAALAALGLVGFGHVLARSEIRDALIQGRVPNVAFAELLIRAGGVIGTVAGGYALVSQSDTTAKVVGGMGALAGASFVISPGWPYIAGLSSTKAITQS
jgi:hypothetical protein